MWLVHFEYDWGLLNGFWSIKEAMNPKFSIKEVMFKFALIGLKG